MIGSSCGSWDSVSSGSVSGSSGIGVGASISVGVSGNSHVAASSHVSSSDAAALLARVSLISSSGGGGSSDDSNVFSSGLSLSRDVVFSFRVVNDLSFNGDVLNSLVDPLNGFLNHDGFLNFSSDVLHLGLDGVVVSHSSLNGDPLISDDFFVFDNFSLIGNLIDLLNLFVFDVFLLEGDVFDSALHGDFRGDSSLGSAGADSVLGDAVGLVGGSSSGRLGIVVAGGVVGSAEVGSGGSSGRSVGGGRSVVGYGSGGGCVGGGGLVGSHLGHGNLNMLKSSHQLIYGPHSNKIYFTF